MTFSCDQYLNMHIFLCSEGERCDKEEKPTYYVRLIIFSVASKTIRWNFTKVPAELRGRIENNV